MLRDQLLQVQEEAARPKDRNKMSGEAHRAAQHPQATHTGTAEPKPAQGVRAGQRPGGPLPCPPHVPLRTPTAYVPLIHPSPCRPFSPLTSCLSDFGDFSTASFDLLGPQTGCCRNSGRVRVVGPRLPQAGFFLQLLHSTTHFLKVKMKERRFLISLATSMTQFPGISL